MADSALVGGGQVGREAEAEGEGVDAGAEAGAIKYLFSEYIYVFILNITHRAGHVEVVLCGPVVLLHLLALALPPAVGPAPCPALRPMNL